MTKHFLVSYAEKIQGFGWEFKNDKTDKTVVDWLIQKKSENKNLLIVFISAIKLTYEQFEQLSNLL